MRIVAAAAAAALLMLSTACSSPPSVPRGFVQLHFSTWPKPWTKATVAVGTDLAVKAVTGHNAGVPTSGNPAVLRSEDWSGRAAPADWYAFKAVAPGRVAIRQSLPCRGTGCSAMLALIEITVTPEST